MKVKITENVPEVTITYDLHMNMTRRDAQALLTVLDHVGGLSSGPRGAMREIYTALHTITRPGKLQGGSHNSLILPDTWEDLAK